MAPPKKYHSEAARKEAERAQRRAYKKRKREEKSNQKAASPKSWIGKKKTAGVPTMQEAMKTITKSLPSASQQGQTSPSIQSSPSATQADTDTLPPLDIPAGASTAETGVEPDGASKDDSAPNASESSSEPSAKQSKAADDASNTIGGEKLAALGASSWCQLLKAGSDLARSMGALGIDDFIIGANYESMHYILSEALKDSDVDPKKYHAYVTVGSGAWVAGNCYYGYAKQETAKRDAAKKAAMEKKGIINGAAETIRSEPVRPEPGSGASGPAERNGAPPASPPGGSGGIDKPKASRYV